jgi:anti-sigma B factor antagonist
MTWLCSSPDPPARRDSRGLLVIKVAVSPEEVMVVITGELDITSRPELAERLSAVLRAKPRRLVLEMSGTSFMDCGSARLIASVARFLPDGRRVIIRRPSAVVRRVLGLTGLDADCQIEG